MDANRRLLFWLKIPYAADAALVLIGVGLLASGRPVGWWVLVFAGGRAIIGTIALLFIAPRVMRDAAAEYRHRQGIPDPSSRIRKRTRP